MKIEIVPCQISGKISAPPSKSWTHRALILAALAKGKSKIIFPLVSEDTEATLNCLQKIGVKIKKGKNFWEVEGITILVLSSNSTLECNSNNYPECGRFIVLGDGKSGIDKSDFVSLCRKEKSENLIYDKCELGKLIVRISNE